VIRKLDPAMLTALAGVGSFGLLFTLGAAIVGDGWTALSVGIGAAIAAANLFVLAQIVAAMVAATSESSGGADGAGPDKGEKDARPADADPAPGSTAGVWGIFAVVKMLVLFAGMWLLMTKGVVAPIPLVVGYGSLPIGIAIGSLVSDKTTRKARSS
jgi:hypothetical protein